MTKLQVKHIKRIASISAAFALGLSVGQLVAVIVSGEIQHWQVYVTGVVYACVSLLVWSHHIARKIEEDTPDPPSMKFPLTTDPSERSRDIREV